jgi:glyoxylase-like metal-dependent hydrolase (beta-lactamase superfamily II)
MKRAALLLAVSLLLPSCATMQSQSASHVNRAVTATGGAEALAGVKTLFEKGTVKYWEPEQSMTPGGEMRFASEASFEAFTDVATGTTAIDWSKKFAYPSPRTFTFGEIVTPEVGYVSGIDSNGRTKQSMEAKPPAHTMSSLRLAAAQRELRRASPLLLLEMTKNPTRLSEVADVTVGGAAYPAVQYRAADNQTFIVMFDKGTGLPARIRTLDYDSIQGDVTYDLVLSDWQTFEGVKIATTRKYELNGRTVAETKLAAVRPNASYASDRLAIPAAFKTDAPKRATGAVPYQWVIRRQFIGAYLDSDHPSFDTRATSSLRLVELAPGVHHVVGGSHHSLLVEMKDHLVVFDAPINDAHSIWVVGQARAKFPNKPVKYLVLTHHHMDHAGGLRGYAAQGATLVVGQGAAAHYRKVLAAPTTRNPDLAPSDLSKTPIVEVAGQHVLSDGAREVHAYVVENNGHADGLLIGYVPEAKLGFATDIWSPGTPLPAKLTPGQAALVATVKKHNLTPTRFAGGHGSTSEYAPLAELEGK